MPALEYVTGYEQVQIAFLLAFTICFIGFFINRRLQKYQAFEQEEKREARRERFMALEHVKPEPQTVDHRK